MKYKTQAKRALRAVGLCRHRPAWVVTGDVAIESWRARPQ
jgi:hypothetical protein